MCIYTYIHAFITVTLTYISLEDPPCGGQVNQEVACRAGEGLRVALAEALHHCHGEDGGVT